VSGLVQQPDKIVARFAPTTQGQVFIESEILLN